MASTVVSLQVPPAQIVLDLAPHLTNPQALQAAFATRDTRKLLLTRSTLPANHYLAPPARRAPRGAAPSAFPASTRQ